jgi:NTE family protein
MRKSIYLLLILVILPFLLFSQRQQKVGLVLSGGGAKGLAHIGVIRALEEENIPIDYVCGTSMGSIIAGLYAAGYSPDEMEDIFFSDDFEYWLSGKIQDKYKPYYRQKDNDESLLNISLDVKNKFKASLPMSLVNPIQMDYAFMEIFASSTKVCNGNFDSLMVPFFCVSTDVDDNKASIRRQGDLGLAIRASMTFPFVFSPIKLDGKTMCDGGIYNNFPAQEMLDFNNPDMIIGVKVAGNYDPPKEGDLKSYIENMITSDSKYDVLCANSVLIEPAVKWMDVMDFTKKRECIDLGYKAAKEQIDSIRMYLNDSVSQEDIAKKREEFKQRKDKVFIGNIIIKGVNDKQKRYIEDVLAINTTKGQKTLADIKKNYFTLCSDVNIQSIQPYIYYDKFMRSYTLDLNVKTKNTLVAKVGGCLSTDPISNMYIGLDYNFFRRYAWQFQTNSYLGRYYKSFMFKTKVDLPNPAFPYFIEGEINLNNWNYFKMRSGIFEYDPKNYLVQKENNFQVHFGIPLSMRDKLVS